MKNSHRGEHILKITMWPSHDQHLPAVCSLWRSARLRVNISDYVLGKLPSGLQTDGQTDRHQVGWHNLKIMIQSVRVTRIIALATSFSV